MRNGQPGHRSLIYLRRTNPGTGALRTSRGLNTGNYGPGTKRISHTGISAGWTDCGVHFALGSRVLLCSQMSGITTDRL